MFMKMRSAVLSSLLLLHLLSCSVSWDPRHYDKQPSTPEIEQQEQTLVIPKFPIPRSTPMATTPRTTTPRTTTPMATPTPTMPEGPLTDDFLGPPECLKKKLTRASCDLVFCLPWERCIEGRCSCKPPYLCPIMDVSPVCGHDNRNYRSYCQVMALSCRIKRPVMSHFGEPCSADHPKFNVLIDADTHVVVVNIPDPQNVEGEQKKFLVCGKQWDMAAANVACKHHGHGYVLGAASADSVSYETLNIDYKQKEFPDRCVSVHCQGYETSLAECVIYDAVDIDEEMRVATATCYDDSNAPKDCDFTCTNGKCVSLNHTCDGVDDCGDRSDEMCCKNCRNGAFRCKTGVCVHKEAVGDEQMDCLDGADEAERHKQREETDRLLKNTEFISPKNETQVSRTDLESKVFCGIPNPNTVDDDQTDVRGRTGRVKRVVGGVRAKPTQIQWQVALEEYKHIDCGGAYIGGCWVITAAHCVRPKPSAFRVKFSLWKKNRAQGTTDIVPVEDIHIHPKYNASTYENDIALVQLQTLPYQQKCLQDNPAVRAVCVPWSTELFQPNHTCSISGWGRNEEGRAAQVLLWANVSLIPKCERFYGDRISPGMMCAGDMDGSVDSCQGDSGGPLVCEDELGVSSLLGIVSWGKRCGPARFPDVSTQGKPVVWMQIKITTEVGGAFTGGELDSFKVAHYFEWIRLHTGWAEVTKFNS